MAKVEREFPSSVNQLEEARGWVVDECRAAWPDAPPEWFHTLELAVQEAAANVVLHSYQGRQGEMIRVGLEIQPDSAAIELLHQGEDFDPGAVAVPDLEAGLPSGYGLHMIQLCVDELRFLHGDPWRGVRLVKRRTPCRENPMQILVEQFDDVAVVTPTIDRLDVSNADDFRQEMEPVLRDYRKVVFDLQRVQFADSRGCGAILSVLKNLTARDGDLRLCRVNPPLKTVFDLIRLHRLCEIHETKEQAVNAFAG